MMRWRCQPGRRSNEVFCTHTHILEKKMVIKNNTNQTGADHAKKKPKQIFVYGNYKAYYGYRIGPDGSEDPRLYMFKEEWFEGKDCLDIGCNQGIVTIDVGKFLFY